MQEIFDRLYFESQKGRYFYNLVEIMKCPENIKLPYRNIKRNGGSKTAGADKKTISDLNKLEENKLVAYVQKKFEWYIPNAIRRIKNTKCTEVDM